MVELTRLNDESFMLNALMIEQIQSYTDTTITLINGKKIVVRNPEEEVVKLITAFYNKIGLIGSLKEVGEASE